MIAGLLLYRVEGASMAPTMLAGDLLLVQEDSRNRRIVSRGDIVVLAQSGRSELKRIIALPGEHIALKDGMLLIDGRRLKEPYLYGLPPYLGLDDSAYDLASDEYFVMGDNRAHSTDSRQYGPVHRAQIIGKVLCRAWPLFRMAGRK